jgi:hypothetical protein
MKSAWLDYFARNSARFEGKQQDTAKFKRVALHTFLYKGKTFVFPGFEGQPDREVDRLVAYAWCRFVTDCERLGIEPGEFVYPV